MNVKIYQGYLNQQVEGDGDVLKLDGVFLAETICCDMRKYGNYLSVRYWIADKPFQRNDAEELTLKLLYGNGDSLVGARYSDITGYLWTDEEINVGGHDLIKELYSFEGKYCVLEIKYNKKPKEGKRR
jgi:hypothetical protein